MRTALIALLFGAMGYNDSMPPPEYRGDAVATVIYLSAEGVQQTCQRATGLSGVIFACTRKRGPANVMVLPNPCPFGEAGERYAELACHEKAHVIAGAWHK